MADKKISALPAASTPLAGTEVLPVVQSGTTDKVSVSDLTSGRTVDMAVANAVLNDAGTNSVSYPLVATHTSTGTTAAGFGVGVNFVQENSTYSTNIQVATIESICTAEPDIHNDLIFKTKYNNTLAERARIKNGADFVLANGNFVPSTAGKGIDFSANAHATGMTSELLNDYEEGVWTPTWNGGTVTVSNAFYTKIGRAVTLIADITFGASASGDPATLTVPFTVGSVWGAGSINFTDVSTTLSVNVDGGANGVLFRTAINAGNEICSNMAGKRVIFGATYFT